MFGRAGTCKVSFDPLLVPAPLFGTHPSRLPIYKCCTILESWDQEHSISEEKMGYTGGKKMTYGSFTITSPCHARRCSKKIFFFENALSGSIHSTYQLASLQTDQIPTLGQPNDHLHLPQSTLVWNFHTFFYLTGSLTRFRSPGTQDVRCSYDRGGSYRRRWRW